MRTEDIVEAIHTAVQQAAEKGSRVVVELDGRNKDWTPDGYGGTLLVQDHKLKVTIAAEPGKPEPKEFPAKT